MQSGRPTRRKLISTTAIVGASSLLAGCSVLDSIFGGGEPLDNGLERVPEPADLAVTLDVQTLLTDDAIRPLVGQYLPVRGKRTDDGRTETAGDALERLEDRTGLDTEKMTSLVCFSGYADAGPVGSYRGCLFTADWGRDAVIDAFQSVRSGVTATSYDGRSVYESSDSVSVPVLGVLNEEWYALGTRSAVTDCIDVDRGETSGLAAPLRRAARSARDAPVVSMGRMAPWLRPARLLDAPSNFELESADGIRVLSGTMDGTGRTRTVTLTVHANNGDTAADLVQLLEGYVGLVAAKENPDGVAEAFAADSTVERRDNRVIVTAERSIEQIEALVTELATA